MRGECPNEQPECKYFDSPEGCYSDSHHIYGRPKKGIAKRFSRLALNQVQLCRAEHEEIHATEGVLPLPSVDVMKQIVAENGGS